jgi:hypothetical protein
MIPIPEVSDLDMAFGNIKHLPEYKDIPEEYKNMNKQTGWLGFISKWFFRGLDDKDMERINPREGVDPKLALRAVGAIMRSFEPKHEHKAAGCAYLMSEWFTIDEKKSWGPEKDNPPVHIIKGNNELHGNG